MRLGVTEDSHRLVRLFEVFDLLLSQLDINRGYVTVQVRFSDQSV